MEEYDVLGKFKDLKSIFKNIPNAVPTASLPDAASSILEDSLDNSDILGELEENIPKKKTKASTKPNKTAKEPATNVEDPDFVLEKEKSPKKQAKTKKQTKKQNAEPVLTAKQQEGVANRTRSSLRSSGSVDTLNNSNASSVSTNESNASISGGRKSKRGKAKTTNANSSPIMAPIFTNGRARGRKAARGRRNNVNVVAPAVLGAIAFGVDAPTTSTTTTTARSDLARDVMRARRNFIAEQAARCPTVGVVDLVTSPLPPMPTGVIDLDAEEDVIAEKPTNNITEAKQLSLDLSFDEDNPEMSVKINWQFKLQVFKLRKYQKFNTIFKQLAEKENIEFDQICLNLNNQIIKPDDTPASIDYKIYQFIDGRAMNPVEFSGGSGAIPKKKRDPNVIKLKVQSDKFKKLLNIEMNKTENFRKLVIKCAEELQLPYENITKLSFDGETIDYQQTPVDLELEGGEIIEIHLKA